MAKGVLAQSIIAMILKPRWAVAFASIFAVGCGSGTSTTQNQTTAPAVPLNITGNWALTAASSVALGSTFPVSVYLTSTNGIVTGIAHITSSCYAMATNVPLSGNVDAAGNVSLLSASVNSQVLSVTGKGATASLLQSGTYSVVGGCAGGDKGTVSGSTVAAVNGTYAGNFSTPLGLVVPVTAKITETVVDSNGFLHLGGTLSFTGSPCFTQAAITTAATDTQLLGAHLTANFTVTSPAAVIATSGSVSADGKALSVIYQILGGNCTGEIGSGILTLQ